MVEEVETFPVKIEHLDIEYICRICLKSDEEMLLIFDDKHVKNGISIKQMIKDCTSCDVIRHDNYPHHVCRNCLENIYTAHSFRKQCQKSHLLVKLFLDNKENSFPSNNVENCSLEKSTQTESWVSYPCEKCEARFWTHTELLDHHFYKHRSSPHVCKICKQVFTRLGYLRDHLSSKHPETGITSRNECKICNKRFSQAGHLTRHLLSVHKVNDFETLTRIVSTKEEINTKETREEDKSEDIGIGDNVDDALDIKQIEIKNLTAETRNENLMEEIEQLFTTNVDGKDENIKDDSSSDEDNYPLSSLGKKSPINQKFINQNAIKLVSIKDHSKKRKQKEKTEFDSQKGDILDSLDSNDVALRKKFKKIDSVKKKRRRSKPEAKLKCKHCDRKFPYPAHLHRHEMTHATDKVFKCPNCSKSFAAEQYLKIHQQNVHADEKPHICKKCQKNFAKEWHLRTHVKKCGIEKPRKYTCSYENCLEAFNCIRGLQKHIKKTHPSDEQIWICRYCKQKFYSRGDIQKHSRIHDSEKPHLCNECGKRFSEVNHLNLHIKRHRGEKRLKCKYCEKRFIRSSDLQIHQMYHTGEKPHKCETCGRGFIRACTLRIHVRTHTGEKPYQCSYCDRSFAQKQDMTAHVRRIHTGERYNCSLCSEGYVHLYQLTHHKKAIHGINQPSHIQRVVKVNSGEDKASTE